MTVRCSILLMAVGSALLGSLAPTPMLAKSTAANSQVTPLPQRRPEPARRPALPQSIDNEVAPVSPPVITLRRASDPPSEASTEPTADDHDLPRLRVPRDGDAPGGTEDIAARDGEIPVGEPEPTERDGEPPTDTDPRLPSDIDAFERPAAGYDAIAFQIDDIDPVLDRRPARLARFEPYTPIGVRRGAWVIFPELEVGAGATSNILRTPAKAHAGFLDVRPTVRVVSNFRRHAVEVRATGLASAYAGFVTENDKAYALEARSRFDITRTTNISAFVGQARDQDSRQARDAVDAARARGDIDTTRLALAVNHRAGPLALQLRGGLTEIDYAPVVTGAGLVISNRQRDVVVRDAAVRGTWSFMPEVAAFTDVQLIDRAYAEATSDGILRDSTGWRALAGLTFGGVQSIWRGEVAVGWGVQTPNDARVTAIDGVLIDANLGWRVNGLTSVLVNARTELNDATTVGQDGSVTRSGGLEVRHAFRRHVIGTAGVRRAVTDYRGVALTETDTTADLGLEYYLDRSTTLVTRYAHAWFDSSTANSDYQVDTIRFGVRWRR